MSYEVQKRGKKRKKRKKKEEKKIFCLIFWGGT